MEVLQRIKIELPHDPGKPLLGIYWKELKPVYYSDTCVAKFIVWHSSQKPGYGSSLGVSQQMNKENVLYIHTMESSSMIKKKIMSFFRKIELQIVL